MLLKIRVLCNFLPPFSTDWIDPWVAVFLYMAKEDCPVSVTLSAAAYQSAPRISTGEI